MKVLFAADGSECTKKALRFLAAHESLSGPNDELLVVNVQVPVPLRIRGFVSSDVIDSYYQAEAREVLEPVEEVLKRPALRLQTITVVGSPAQELLAAANRYGAQLIVMGTHGRGPIGRVLMGSVAQRVVAECNVPVLLVK